MSTNKKGRRTRRRTEARAESRQRGASLSAWLQDSLGAAQKKAADARAVKPTEPQRDPVWVVQHSTPNRAMRRSRRGA